MDYLVRNIIFSLLCLCLGLHSSTTYAQSSVKVSAPRLELEGNILHIYYDLLEGLPGEQYNVRAEIKDEDGKIIDARTMEGDIGQLEEGGNNKHIRWNLEADQIFIDAYLYVKINATVIPPPVVEVAEQKEDSIPLQDQDIMDPVVQEEQDTPTEELIVEKDMNERPVTGSKRYSRTGLMLQSLAFPGLGLSRYTGKPHWIRGVVGYGCLAGSVIMNRKAINTLGHLDYITRADEIANSFEKSVTQDQTSEFLAYAAVGIWVTDIIWNFMGTSDLSRSVSIRSNLDPLTFVPMISVSYRF